MKAYQLIPKYIWQYKAVVGLFFIFVAVFAIVLTLYRAAVEAVLYAALLCAVAAMIFVGLHFYFYVKKHKERLRFAENPLTMTLPAVSSLTDQDYIRIVEKLRECYFADKTARQEERLESIDYFNTWIHQIKTPIAVMQLSLQAEDTEEHRALSAELFRIEQYVEMSLCYFRLDDSSSDLVLKNYDLDEIVRESIRKYAPLFVRKKIKLNYEPIGQTVLTDKKWLAFIVEQLLSNAVKYTERGEITITAEDKVLKISDTGIGIAPEDIPRIFERGYTGYNGRSGRKSTGLGLYLSKKAADKLSHKLSVSSVLGEGSTFAVDMNTYDLRAE